MQLTAEHRQIADTVERFIVNEVNPPVPAWEAAGEFPSHRSSSNWATWGCWA